MAITSNMLVLFAVISVSLADKLPSRSGYTFPPPFPAFNIRQQPAPQTAVFSAPRPVAPSRSSFSSTQAGFSAPRPVAPSRSSFSSSQAGFSAPRPVAPSRSSFSASQAAFSAPQPAFSASQAVFSAPQPAFSASRPAFSAPQGSYSAPQSGSFASARPVVPILRDDRIHPEAGAYSFMLETGDGVVRKESGSPIYSKEGPVTAVTGSYSFPLPDGQVFELHYVADENGFQPQSPFLPVAPAFPHPIPAHALEQIERGRREHEARARGELRQDPSQSYSAPSRLPPPQRPSNSYSFPQ